MENLYGLIGEKLSHTYSPLIHGEILKKINISGHYGLFQVKRENLKYAILGLKALSYKGVNVTIPYKSDIIDYLDIISLEAKKINAINVINIDENGISSGHNTDYYGFLMMLQHENIKINGEKIVILGTGGASKAVTQCLIDNNAKEISFMSRNEDLAKKKYPQHKIITYENLKELKDSSIIINTTPVGMYPKTGLTPLDKSYLSHFQTAIDLIYNPSQTLFLKQAKEEGLKTINGLYMLVAQAVKSQEIWNQIEIPLSVIDDIVFLIEREIR